MFEFWGGGGGLYNVPDPTPTTTTKFDKENVPQVLKSCLRFWVVMGVA